jgi:hypothetical protein
VALDHLPLFVPSGDTMHLMVEFAPTTVGKKQATLTIGTSDPRRSSVQIPMIGYGGTSAVAEAPILPVIPKLKIAVRPTLVRSEGEIAFSLDGSAALGKIRLIDPLGRTVRELYRGAIGAAERSIRFSCADVPSGIYLIEAIAIGRTAVEPIAVEH